MHKKIINFSDMSKEEQDIFTMNKKFSDLSKEEQDIFKNKLEIEMDEAYNKELESSKRNNCYCFSKLSISILECRKYGYNYYDVFHHETMLQLSKELLPKLKNFN